MEHQNQQQKQTTPSRSSATSHDTSSPGTASFPARSGSLSASHGSSDTATEDVVNHLSLREGYRRDVYLDSRKLPTVGTGHLLSKSELARYPLGSIVPDRILERWRQEDTAEAYSNAKQKALKLKMDNQELVNALTAVNFQLGTGWHQEHRKTWNYLKDQNWEAAAEEAANSKWFNQTPVRIFDFQRVLLNLAGKPTDYESMVEFNSANIKKWKVKTPSKQDVDAFTVEGGSAQQAPTTNTSPSTTPESSNSGSQESEPETANHSIQGNVGLKDDGKTYIGNSADIKWAQQQLIYAGFLSEMTTNRQGRETTNIDGILGNKTIDAIKSFQQSLGFKRPDGRIDVGGRTFRALSKYSGAQENSQPESEPVAETPGTAPTITPPVSKPNEVTPNTGETDEMESVSDTAGPTSDVTSAMKFEEVPTEFANKYKIGRSVGSGGSNNSTDTNKIKSVLRMLGYRDTTIKRYSSSSQRRRKLRIQIANSIFHYQSQHANLSNDGRVDPNGGTWKQMILSAYQASNGDSLSEDQLQEIHNKRKGSRSEVPSSLIPSGVTNGHLLGIDNSGYLLPEGFRSNATLLKGELEKIVSEVGTFRISCGYRSPEHNVKIGSTAKLSKHVIGQAADIQTMRGYTSTSLHNKITQMMASGVIKKGKALKYSWGVHYDVR